MRRLSPLQLVTSGWQIVCVLCWYSSRHEEIRVPFDAGAGRRHAGHGRRAAAVALHGSGDGPAGKPPDTVFLEELTWAETRDLVAAGTTTVIIGTAGTEQKGPHMVDGEHKFVMEYAADKIARATRQDLGRARDHLCAGRQLGKSRRPHEQARHDHAARGSVRRAARLRGPQPQVGRLQDHPLPRRVGRQSYRHANGRQPLERDVERRGQGLLGRRLLHQVARRSERLHHQDDGDSRGSDRRSCQSSRHVGDAVRQRQARAHEEARTGRRLREQRRQRRSVQVQCGAGQGLPADQDRQRARADQGDAQRRRARRR